MMAILVLASFSHPMHVRKAVITAAAPKQNRLPLQQLVDRQGDEKSALQLVTDEFFAAGIEEICVVVRPGDQDAYAAAAGGSGGSIQFAVQPEPRGYADAIVSAAEFVGDDAFLHSVGDHVYLSTTDQTCAEQLVAIAADRDCCVSAVQATRETNLSQFGIVSGPHLPREDRLYEVQTVIEKPTPTLAEQDLVTPGLRSGYYLGFFGMHVLTAEVMALLREGTDERASRSSKPKDAPESPDAPELRGGATLSDALARLPGRSQYLAAELCGTRYNLGIKYGLLKAQLAIGLAGDDRDQILSDMVEMLAMRKEVGVA